jgi:hypothetical protein
MRYVIVIADGSALAGAGEDLYAALDAAETPALDAIGRLGKVGVARTRVGGIDSFGRGTLALLGCDEGEVLHLSDSALEAHTDPLVANRDLAFGPVSVLRVRLVSVSPDDSDGLMIAADTGGVSPAIPSRESTERGAPRTDEYAVLLDDLVNHWRDEGLLSDGLRTLTPGSAGPKRSGSALLVAPQRLGDPTRFVDVDLVDPRAIEGEPWIEHLPDSGYSDDAEFLCRLISASRSFLAEHPINAARTEQGLDPINLAWFSDAGLLSEVYNPFPSEAACFTESGFEAGGRLVYLLGLGASTVEPRGMVDAIVGATAPIVVAMTSREIESVDAQLIRPLTERLAGRPIGEIDTLDDEPWRLLFAVSHDPQGAAGTAGGMTPFALAGGHVRSIVERRLCDAPESDLVVDPASDLLEYVLRSGLRGLA